MSERQIIFTPKWRLLWPTNRNCCDPDENPHAKYYLPSLYISVILFQSMKTQNRLQSFLPLSCGRTSQTNQKTCDQKVGFIEEKQINTNKRWNRQVILILERLRSVSTYLLSFLSPVLLSTIVNFFVWGLQK